MGGNGPEYILNLKAVIFFFHFQSIEKLENIHFSLAISVYGNISGCFHVLPFLLVFSNICRFLIKILWIKFSSFFPLATTFIPWKIRRVVPSVVCFISAFGGEHIFKSGPIREPHPLNLSNSSTVGMWALGGTNKSPSVWLDKWVLRESISLSSEL